MRQQTTAPPTRSHLPTATSPDRSGLRASETTDVMAQESRAAASCVVVAGYDGTPLGRSAVFEAGIQAGPGGRVFVVYAYRPPPSYLGSPDSDRRLGPALARGTTALAELLDDPASLPPSEYVPELLAGPPAVAIARVADARHAAAILVGASRRRGVIPMRRGVLRTLLRTARVPVMTIPRARSQAAAAPQPVVSPDRTRAGESVLPHVSTWW